MTDTLMGTRGIIIGKRWFSVEAPLYYIDQVSISADFTFKELLSTALEHLDAELEKNFRAAITMLGGIRIKAAYRNI